MRIPVLLEDSESHLFKINDMYVKDTDRVYIVGTNYTHWMDWDWKLEDIVKGSIYYTLKNNTNLKEEDLLSSTNTLYKKIQDTLY